MAKAPDRSIPGAVGALPARVYSPPEARPFSVVLYFHDGGWVIANKGKYDATLRALAD
jgi:acetyl esterase/lipase